MSEQNAFLIASQKKLRFATGAGALSIEDLWDLSLRDLDTIAGAVIRRLEATSSSTSILSNPDRKAAATQKEEELRLEILKAVVGVKEEENKAALDSRNKAAQLAFLKSLREKREIEKLEGQTLEEIDAQIAALES